MTDQPTSAQQIVADCARTVYPFTCVSGACHDKRVSHAVDQVNLVDVYTFEDGSRIVFHLAVLEKHDPPPAPPGAECS